MAADVRIASAVESETDVTATDVRITDGTESFVATLPLTGALHTAIVNHTAGTVATGTVTLAGSLHVSASTHTSGTIVSTVALTGTLRVLTPARIAGTAALSGLIITGVLHAPLITHTVGAVSGLYTLTGGSLHVSTITHIAGSVESFLAITGILHTAAPIHTAGIVAAGPVVMTGSAGIHSPPVTHTVGIVSGLYTLSGTPHTSITTHIAGGVASIVGLTDTTHVSTTTHTVGAVATGPVHITGVLHTVTPTHTAGILIDFITIFTTSQVVWDVNSDLLPTVSYLGGLRLRTSIVQANIQSVWDISLATSPAYPTAGTVGFTGSEPGLTVIEDSSSAPAGTTWNSTYNYLDVRTDSLTLDGVYIKGGIDFYGTGTLTITNSVVEGGYGSWMIVNMRDFGGSLDTSDTTLRWKTGEAPLETATNGGIHVTGNHDDNSIMRCDISGTPDGILIIGDNWIVGECHIHDLATITSYSNNCIQVSGGLGHRVISNNLNNSSAYNNAPLLVAAAGTGIDIRGNYLDGGGYLVDFQDGNISFSDNTLGANYLYSLVRKGIGSTVDVWSNNLDSYGTLVPSP